MRNYFTLFRGSCLYLFAHDLAFWLLFPSFMETVGGNNEELFRHREKRHKAKQEHIPEGILDFIFEMLGSGQLLKSGVVLDLRSIFELNRQLLGVHLVKRFYVATLTFDFVI